MGTKYLQLQPLQLEFIAKQHIFFVATATDSSRINLSPKDTGSLHIISPDKVLWLNLTGSGNETAAHLQKDNRMTIMFCSFDANPMILRLYGSAKVIYPSDENWQDNLKHFKQIKGARQLIELNIEMTMNSCGFGVPTYDFISNREKLLQWTEKKGEAGILDYQQEKNTTSLDGKTIRL